MKKTNKKNSTARKLLPAFAMLTVSAISLSSATYAWFTMNKTVSVTNMQVKATAEEGLLISETNGKTSNDKWDDVATANNLPTSIALLPTSTSNTLAWYHANSKSANDEAGAAASALDGNLADAGYTTLTSLDEQTTSADSGTNAANVVYFKDKDNNNTVDAGEDAYYVKYTYYLKASNTGGISSMGLANGAQNLSIKDVTVSGSSGSVNLDKSLRVGVAINSKFYIFAPNYTGTGADVPADYYVYNGTSTTGTNIKIAPLAANGVAYTDVSSLPGVDTSSPIQADVYLWYEGEDVNCKSENVTTSLDTLTVGLKFDLSTNSAARDLPADNAKSTVATP
ncbi:MAG: hypothetical protein E7495_10295 [Ruminococcus flavefaciens]|jgi:hypothetical protein|nr:hypothetical protein [Ruminococcus flavefaciens]